VQGMLITKTLSYCRQRLPQRSFDTVHAGTQCLVEQQQCHGFSGQKAGVTEYYEWGHLRSIISASWRAVESVPTLKPHTMDLTFPWATTT
jgi:hypothetical protein